MRGIDIFQNPYYREISTMRGRTMRVLPVELEVFIQTYDNWFSSEICSDHLLLLRSYNIIRM